MNYLHNHDEYSNVKYYDSINKAYPMCKLAKEYGSTAIAMTNHDTMSGTLEFLKAAKKAEIKPIIGNEIYLTRDNLTSETHEKGEPFYHMILLAKDRQGYNFLNELSSHAWNNSYTKFILRTPTYISFFENLMKTLGREHIVITSACVGGLLGRDALKYFETNDEAIYQNIKNKALWLADLCGEDHFYLEVQPALYNDQILYNGLLLRLSQETNIPLVVATDTHYLNKEDFELHKVFLNSQRENSAVRETEAFYKYTYLMPEDEVRANLKANPNFTDEIIEQCIQNTYKISDMCEEYDISSSTYLMETPEREQGWEQWLEQKYGLYVGKIPALELYYNSKEIDKYFIYMVLSKYEEKVGKGWITKKERTIERLQEELDVIFAISNRINENLSKYFLTMRDLLNIMWEISVIGAGRGSAGASMINFLFDITSLNPLEVYDDFELPFWRFLDKDRPELPDIDLDNSASRKEEILKLVSDYVSTFNHTIAKVATFGKLKSKQALQVAAGGLGYEPEIKTYLSSMVPIHRGFPLGLKECVETGVFADVMEEFGDVINLAIEIEGLVVSVGQHAAAITFFNNNDKFSRTAFIKRPKDNIPTTAFDLHMLEELGAAIKFDTLQTVAVDALQTSIMLLVENGEIEWQGTLKKTYDKYLHPSVINHTDKRIWNKICNKQVYSLFQ